MRSSWAESVTLRILYQPGLHSTTIQKKTVSFFGGRHLRCCILDLILLGEGERALSLWVFNYSERCRFLSRLIVNRYSDSQSGGQENRKMFDRQYLSADNYVFFCKHKIHCLKDLRHSQTFIFWSIQLNTSIINTTSIHIIAVISISRHMDWSKRKSHNLTWKYLQKINIAILLNVTIPLNDIFI